MTSRSMTVERDEREDRREVERPGHRQQAPEEPQVRLRDVVEEALDPVERQRVRQPHPAHEDVREQDDAVERDEDVDERLDARDRVSQRQAEAGRDAHAARFAPNGSSPVAYAWLKKPRSSIRARSSADSSTSRGVRRKTLSAIRCIPPSSAYVRPLAKSMSRFDSSASGGLEVEDHRDAVLVAVGDLLGVVEAARQDEVDLRRAGPRTASRLRAAPLVGQARPEDARPLRLRRRLGVGPVVVVVAPRAPRGQMADVAALVRIGLRSARPRSRRPRPSPRHRRCRSRRVRAPRRVRGPSARRMLLAATGPHPTRTKVAPSSAAMRKSWLVPIESSCRPWSSRELAQAAEVRARVLRVGGRRRHRHQAAHVGVELEQRRQLVGRRRPTSSARPRG